MGYGPYITDGEIQAIIGQERGDVSRIQQRIIKTAKPKSKK